MDCNEKSQGPGPLSNITNVFVLPKGNWTKQLKGLPSNFNETIIHEHHVSRKSSKHKIKGYRMFKAKRVTNLLISHESSKNITHLNSKVHASYKVQKTYKVHVVLNTESGEIRGGSCECKSGKCGVCCHVSATLWFILDCIREGLKFIPNDVSPTDIAQKWGKLNVRKNLSTTRYSILNFLKHNPDGKKGIRKTRKACIFQYSSIVKELNKIQDKQQIKRLVEDFKSLKKRPMWQKILIESQYTALDFKPVTYYDNIEEPSKEQSPCDLERISLPVQEIQADIEISFPESLRVTLEESRLIEEKTRDQAASQLWKAERSERLTASNFGQIIKRRAKVTEKFLNSLRGGTDISRLKHVKEGLENEEQVKTKYYNFKNKEVYVFKVGLVINPGFPILGASPDGLVFDKKKHEFGLLEIKTFSKAKELGLTIDEVIAKKMNNCLKKDSSGLLFLNRIHNYYYQVQGQLGLTGLSWCDFVVDSGADIFCERIMFDSKLFFETRLPKLDRFYFCEYRKNDSS